MRDRKGARTRARRLARSTVALLCAAVAYGQSQPTSQPTTRPVLETLAMAHQRLGHTPPAQRTRKDEALLGALDWALALGRVDGARAAALVDPVGHKASDVEIKASTSSAE